MFQLALLYSVSYFFFLYWSPSSSWRTVFDAISSNIDEVLSINPFGNSLAFENFNFHHKGWLTYSGRINNFCISNDLSQIVDFSTRTLLFRKNWKNSLWLEKFWSYWSSNRKGVTLFISQLVTILLLLGTVFVIIFKMFYVKISLNSKLLLQVLNFVSGSTGWNWCIYPSS